MSFSDGKPEILEVTLRDGSYVIDFQFTTQDTATIGSALEAVGFRWIELGHGLGLHASESGKGRAAARDEEYLETAAQTFRCARWGTFFIPGIGREEDLRLAAKYKMSFVRVGTNITEMDEARPSIELAKQLGMVVSWNAMKSYTVAPAEFGACAATAAAWGADIVCLVDSAGGMYPEDVSAYFRAAQQASDVALGFHGHDNLSLAIANALRAIECGVALVDTSLQGLGRSGGNASTEILVAILKQKGLLAEMDLNAVLDVGRGLIQPLVRQRGLDPMTVTAGYAQFHSSHMAKVQHYADKYQLDVRDLIVRVCREDKVDAPDGLLDRLAHELASEKVPRVIPVRAIHRPSARRLEPPQALELLLKEMRPRAVKAGKRSVLNIVIAEQPTDDFVVSGNIQDTPMHMVGSASLTRQDRLVQVLEAVDGAVDVVFLDVDHKPFGPPSPAATARQHLKEGLLLTYSDSDVWVQAVEDQVVRLLGEAVEGEDLTIFGHHPKSLMLALRLGRRLARVALLGESEDRRKRAFLGALKRFWFDPATFDLSYHDIGSRRATEKLRRARLVVAWPRKGSLFSAEHASQLRQATHVIDAGVHGLSRDGIEEARRRKLELIRVNMWPALIGALSAAEESARGCREALRRETLAGVPVVAGGAMGRRGDVIVDSISNPMRVIGVADGLGGVLYEYTSEQAEQVSRVAMQIDRQRIASNPSREA